MLSLGFEEGLPASESFKIGGNVWLPSKTRSCITIPPCQPHFREVLQVGELNRFAVVMRDWAAVSRRLLVLKRAVVSAGISFTLEDGYNQ